MSDESQVPLDDESTDGLDSDVGEGGVGSFGSDFTPGKPASLAGKILVVLLVTTLVIGGIYVATPDFASSPLSMDERPGFDQEVARWMLTGMRTPWEMPGVNRPEIRDLADVRFASACPVIGVTVGDSHRAYPMATLVGGETDEGETPGIVNDRVGGKPITVTHDVELASTRVVCLPEGSTRKTIGMMMWGRGEGGGMVLRLNDNYSDFRFDTEEWPELSDYQFETTTLKKWQEEHSGTDVYVGEFVTPDLQMESTLKHMTAPERLEADRVLEERNRKRKILSPGRKTGPASEPAGQPDVQPEAQPKKQPEGQ
jgi:hypothetical protein